MCTADQRIRKSSHPLHPNLTTISICNHWEIQGELRSLLGQVHWVARQLVAVALAHTARTATAAASRAAPYSASCTARAAAPLAAPLAAAGAGAGAALGTGAP